MKKKLFYLLGVLALTASLSLPMVCSAQQNTPAPSQQQGTWVCPRTGQVMQAGQGNRCGQRARKHYRNAQNCPWQTTTSPTSTDTPAAKQ
ncbi:hypothetical protein [Desulforhabdus amnigena]|uniref:Secreted protein n=1 Tax=Desulforhabdus amnigena TaxID=40218 RepID=A0A9W6FU86_9BACT|nr:hypothetical protein [Desulforhabdus amnigena]NLJ27442.1 hypothetical protein [Deltaproteobacteria bacterium]GLI34967.1 hypothetical protein DAMNIGENAA_24000 [Desulforhabdus amnigena]